jgi:hypothetical protein
MCREIAFENGKNTRVKYMICVWETFHCFLKRLNKYRCIGEMCILDGKFRFHALQFMEL